MKPVLKILFWLIGVVFTLIIIAAIVLPLLVDPNDFRDDIGQAVKKQTGRELIIEGDLSLSVVPWLGVKVGRASLSNAPGLGDEPMLAIEGASVGVRLIPLLSRRLEVSEITLDGARINLYRGASGSNWDDLTGAQEATAEPTPATDSPAFGMSEIGGIRLRDARVRFVDDVERIGKSVPSRHPSVLWSLTRFPRTRRRPSWAASACRRSVPSSAAARPAASGDPWAASRSIERRARRQHPRWRAS